MIDDASWILEWSGVSQETEVREGQGILLFVERPDEALVTQAMDLAEALTMGVSAVLVGETATPFLQEKGIACFSEVKLSPDFPVAQETFQRVAQLVEEAKPEIVMFGLSPFSRQVVPALAEKSQLGLAGPARVLTCNLDTLALTHVVPYYEGRLNADIICGAMPQLVVVTS